MKSLYKSVLIVYLIALLWLVLFKLSVDAPTVLHLHIQVLNLIPFAIGGNIWEMIENAIIFMPLGLLLGVNMRQVGLWRKLAFVSVLSVAAETIQFVLAIGVSDITDVVMNMLGGFIGLVVYESGRRLTDKETLDRFVVVVTTTLLVLFLLLRFFFFKVKY